MWFYRLVVLVAVLQLSVGTGEGRTDQFVLSLCRLWEDCIKTVEVADSGEVATLQTVCRVLAHMKKKRHVLDCESQLDTKKQVGNTEQPKHLEQSQSNLAPQALSFFGRTNYFSDCSEIHTALTMFNAVSSGVHDIKPEGLDSPISVYCDQTTDGGGWTVIQRRFDGSIDFNRPYNDFRYGFGSANGEQWLGLENMYRLTNQDAYEIYIELEDWDSVVKYAKYSSFSVGSGSYYRLSVGGYSGTAGDGFYLSGGSSHYNYLNGQAFSTRDVDRDGNGDRSCAGGRPYHTGGWWYKSCAVSALNGPYLRPSDRTSNSGYGIYWNYFGGSYYQYLKKSKMMVRPANFQP